MYTMVCIIIAVSIYNFCAHLCEFFGTVCLNAEYWSHLHHLQKIFINYLFESDFRFCNSLKGVLVFPRCFSIHCVSVTRLTNSLFSCTQCLLCLIHPVHLKEDSPSKNRNIYNRTTLLYNCIIIFIFLICISLLF